MHLKQASFLSRQWGDPQASLEAKAFDMDRFEIGAYMGSESHVFLPNLANRHLLDKNRKNVRKSDNIKRPLKHLKQGYFLSKEWGEAKTIKIFKRDFE